MVYIDRDGRVLERRPWSMQRIMEIFTGLWLVVVHFFTTLIAPFMNDNRNSGSSSNSRRSGWDGGGGGGGGGGNGPRRGGGGGGGFNEGLRPNRRIGRVVNTSMDCNIPGGG